MAETDIIQKLRRLRSRYRDNLPQRLWEIRECWDAFVQGQERSGLAQELYHHLHQLAGSAETFGLPRVSACARRCLDALRPLCEGQQQTLSPQSLRICEDSLEDMVDALWRAGPNHDMPARDRAPLQEPVTKLTLLAMPGDPALTDLAQLLEQKDYQVETRSEPPTGPASDPARSRIFLLDLNLVAPGAESRIASHLWGQPLAALAGVNDFQTRVRAVRVGARALFTRPFDVSDITLWLNHCASQGLCEYGRILIMRGGDAELPGLEAYLSRHGYETQTLSDPDELLQLMNNFRPELVIIDHPDPPFSEQEIAAAIRIDPKHLALPVILLGNRRPLDGVELDGQTVRAEARTAPALLQAVRGQLSQGRLLYSRMARDSLTQLLNHGECQQQLRLGLLRAERQGHNLCVAMIDIDHFKSVNDRFGHAWGDRVLKNTARLITSGLRRTDLVARYGGEEFLMILPDTGLDDAWRIAEKLRTSYASFNHGAQQEPLSVTLSVGLAAYPAHRSPHALLRAADQALYQAKRAGRNQTVAASPASRQIGERHA